MKCQDCEYAEFDGDMVTCNGSISKMDTQCLLRGALWELLEQTSMMKEPNDSDWWKKHE